MAQAAPAPRRRNPTHLRKLSRSPVIGRFAIVNHFRRKVDQLTGKSHFPGLSAFLPQNFFPWFFNYLKFVFTKRYRFPGYSHGKDGVYRLAPSPGKRQIRIAVAGDWGTGTQEAQTIAKLMAPSLPAHDSSPDLTIHLGDVYYVGDTLELDENCFGKGRDGFSGVTWPHGTQGSFALNGNHEMYANGKPYFTRFLSSLGMPDRSGQIASYFCLETEFWRIIGLDTGYNSVGFPILSQIPLINNIPAIGGDCHLERKTLTWLRETVKPTQSRKATLLLTHHQYYTAFDDKAYTRPAQQLKEFFGGQDIVWIWGHEHRLGIYDRFDTGAGIRAYGRCVGHGGMPVETGDPDPKKAPLQLYDTRTHALDDGSQAGENGFVILTIDGPALGLDYRDISNRQLLLERFTATANGTIEYLVVNDPGILKSA